MRPPGIESPKRTRRDRWTSDRSCSCSRLQTVLPTRYTRAESSRRSPPSRSVFATSGWASITSPLTVISRAPLQLASYIAAKTTRLRVGTAVIVVPLHHPLLVAEPHSDRRSPSSKQRNATVSELGNSTAGSSHARRGRNQRLRGVQPVCGRHRNRNAAERRHQIAPGDCELFHLARDAEKNDHDGRRDRHQDARRDAQDHPVGDREVDAGRGRSGHTARAAVDVGDAPPTRHAAPRSTLGRVERRC